MIISTLLEPERHPLWAGIRALLKAGGDRSNAIDWEPEHVVWVVIEDRQIIAAFSTRLLDDDGSAEVFNIGGHRAVEWLPEAEKYATMWARLAGATRIAARGRKGWQRLNAPLGWEAIGQDGQMTFYEKVL